MAKSTKAATPTRGTVQTPEVMEPENPTVALVRSDVSAIEQWSRNIAAFFAGASELEMAARSRLVMMERMQTPTSGSEDAQIQDLVRLSNAGKKATTEYWTITGALDKLHKLAVSHRKRATDADDQAAAIGNRLHTTYAEAARRAAQAEEDRIRREREEQAQQKRQAELDQLEAAALKAEASSPNLSERERLFVDHVVADHYHAGKCARLAGYKDKDCDAVAVRLLGMAKIKKAIEAGRIAIRMRQQAEAVKASPVAVEDVTIRPDLNSGGDRTTWSGRIMNEQAVIDAVIRGEAPRSLLCVNQTAVNVLARSMRENLDRIPGLQHVKKTNVI